MGTPDTFVVVDPEDAKRFLNGDGKPMLDIQMQSKSFGSTMDYYYIFGGVAYGSCSRWGRNFGPKDCEAPLPEEWDTVERNGEVILVQAVPYRRSSLNHSGLVYCTDNNTRPVLALADNRHNYIQERYPWCEWEIEFKDGGLVRVTPKKVQTRADVIGEVQDKFSEVLLADNHPIAVKHFYDLEHEDD